MPWIRYAAAGTLAASGALLVTGKRRAGLVTAITGAVLAMLDQQEVVSAWWNALPGYLEEIQGVLGRAQTAVEDLSAQGQKLRRVLGNRRRAFRLLPKDIRRNAGRIRRAFQRCGSGRPRRPASATVAASFRRARQSWR